MAIDGFDDGYGDPSDYGMSQEDFNDASAIGQATYSGDSDQLAQAIANSTARARSDPRGDPSRSNVIGMANYDPSFAASLDISRGLDPRGIAGFKDTAFAKTNTPNPLQQLDQTQVNRITDALKLSGASDTYKQVSSLRGDDLKNYAAGMDLKGLNLADFDKMDTQSLANVFSSLGMTDKNPYGISAQGTSTGTIGAISNLLGLDTTPDFSRKGTPTYMSPKDIAEKARAGFGFASSGRNPSEFGSLGGIANQFGRDVSAGAKQIQNDLIQLADGAMSYLSNKGKAGDTVENIVAEQNKLQGPPLPPSQFDQFGNMVRSSIYDYSGNPTEPLSVIQNRRNKIEDLQQNASEVAQLREQGTDPNFIPNTFPTIDRTNVLNNSFMDSGASLATDPNLSSEDIALRRQFSQDIANASNASNTGITALPEAKPFSESINNQEIAAGTKKGSTLTDREQEDTANYADYLNRVGKAKNEYELYNKAMGYLFANRQKDLPKEVQSKQQANLYPKDIVYLNQLAEDENVAREVYNNLLDLGPKRDFTSSNVNIIPDFFNKDGFTLENKYYNNIFTPKQVEEMRNKGYSLQGIDQLRRTQQFPDKKTVSFSDLSDRNKEQYFLNTNLDYGAPIKTPYNVVY